MTANIKDEFASPMEANAARVAVLATPPSSSEVVAFSNGNEEIRAGQQFVATIYTKAPTDQNLVWSLEGRWNVGGAKTAWIELTSGTRTAATDGIDVFELADGAAGPNEFRFKWNAAAATDLQAQLAATFI